MVHKINYLNQGIFKTSEEFRSDSFEFKMCTLTQISASTVKEYASIAHHHNGINGLIHLYFGELVFFPEKGICVLLDVCDDLNGLFSKQIHG